MTSDALNSYDLRSEVSAGLPALRGWPSVERSDPRDLHGATLRELKPPAKQRRKVIRATWGSCGAYVLDFLGKPLEANSILFDI